MTLIAEDVRPVNECIRLLEMEILGLLRSPIIRFDESCRSALPEAHGIYRIFYLAKQATTIRAGRTKTAAGGLRQRIYQNHLMGSQAGNLQAQLVARGDCADLKAAKRHTREKLGVQVHVVEDADQRKWLEHFMLSVIRPEWCD